MRCLILSALIVAAAASPAHAEFNAYYRGVDRMTDKEVPAAAEIHLAPGRVAIVATGSRNTRMLFLEEAAILRFVDDAEKSYFDMDAGTSASSSGMMAEVDQRLAQLPPDQRRMAEEMIQKSLDAGQTSPAVDYVRTKVTQKVLQYDCTLVEVVRGGEKVGEYCGSNSKEFLLSDAERKTMLAMQQHLDKFSIAMKSAEGGGPRAFQWDAKADGLPLISRCLEKKKITFEVQLESFDRKPLEKDPFAIPSDYEMTDFPEAPKAE